MNGAPACLAFGAWLKNRACLVGVARAAGELNDLPADVVRWSPLHGDLGDPGACEALEASVEALIADATRDGIEIGVVAHDLHPDFFSSQLAVRIAERLGVPAIAVQHHHAHIAAALAEAEANAEPARGARSENPAHRAAPVIGIALDGVGLGTDGAAWGGELLLVGPRDWRRLGALHPLALPGGDVAAREPWRMAAALLHAIGRADAIEPRLAPRVGELAARTVATMLARNLNCPPSSGAGRWFDAIAGLLALSDRQAQEAEAAIALEDAARMHLERNGLALADCVTGDGWRLAAQGASSFVTLDLRPFAQQLLDAPADTGHWAAAFHATFAAGLADLAIAAAREHGAVTVALSGGCFFNRLLRRDLGERLARAGLDVIDSARAGLGDSGVALGQAWVARHALAA